jgi:hypothetical protein
MTRGLVPIKLTRFGGHYFFIGTSPYCGAGTLSYFGAGTLSNFFVFTPGYRGAFTLLGFFHRHPTRVLRRRDAARFLCFHVGIVSRLHVIVVSGFHITVLFVSASANFDACSLPN